MLYYAIRKISCWTFSINNIAVFYDIIVICLLGGERTSKIFYLVHYALAYRYGTNSSAINILLIALMQNFT